MTPPLALFVDTHLLVVDKPAGLLSVPGRGEDKQDCLVARLQVAWPGALTVHRLDMATSGLMVFARDAATQAALGAAFAERRVQKRYIAVVDGLLQQGPVDAQGWSVIDLPLAADWPRRPLQKVDPVAGKPSITRWKVLGHDAADGTTRVALEPLTGRSHQLRVHLQALGHTIAGDALYAPEALAARVPRLMLHAERLAFEHPVTGEPLLFEHPARF